MTKTNSQVQEVLQMQSDIRAFLALNFEEEPIPFNAHRLGLYSEEKVAIDVGMFNYKELIMLHTYIDKVCNHFRKTTLLGLMVEEKPNVYSIKLPIEAYRVELTMIAWLGTNVGQGFLMEYEDNARKFENK